MKRISIWQDIKTNDYHELKENIKTDILIIGGGITGVNLLYALKDDKRSVTLVEKNKLGMGVTSRSTAKITYLQQDIYSKLKRNFDTKTAFLYYTSMKETIKQMVDIINKERIACDLEKAPSYFYALSNSEIAKVEEEKAILQSFGDKVYDAPSLPNDMPVKAAIYVKDTYVFHPLKYVAGLSKKAISKNHQIYENTNIYNIEETNGKYLAYTKDNVIECNIIVLACHYPYFLFPYLFPIKGYLEKSYLVASLAKNKEFSAINIDKPLYSCRYYKTFLISLSSSHNLSTCNNRETSFASLLKMVDNKAEYIWSNSDIMTLDNLPYVGAIKDNMYLATGYNTWGMTGSFLAASCLKDLLQGSQNKYEKLLSPKRGLSKDKIINTGVSLWSSGYSLILSKINLNKSWYHRNPYFTTVDGVKVGIYTDENKNSHIVKIKCPHLGCSLLFNEVEHLWECPCHGSVFDIDGKCIIGPSNYDISIKNENRL